MSITYDLILKKNQPLRFRYPLVGNIFQTVRIIVTVVQPVNTELSVTAPILADRTVYNYHRVAGSLAITVDTVSR